jgi:hypothetical protein
MVKILSIILVLCICGVALSAQEKLPPLESKLKISIDVPFFPFWDTVKVDRIKNRTIQFGGSATPWKSTAMFSGLTVPRVIFTESDVRIVFEGGIMKTHDENTSRTMGQVHAVIEGAIWFVLVGSDGFFGQEQIPKITRGMNFETDFLRRSSGGQGWFGMKFGDFNQDFVVVRYGRGYVWTKGETHFIIPDIDNSDWLPLYLEQFRTVSLSAEGTARARRISQSVRLDAVEYERVIPSPDPVRFGENHIRDMWLRTETEVIPFSRLRSLRGVVVLTKDFRNQNRLMFLNDYSSVQVFLRILFN